MGSGRITLSSALLVGSLERALIALTVFFVGACPPDVLGLLRDSIFVIFLVVVVDGGQVLFLTVDLGQTNIHVDVVDADLGRADRLLRRRNGSCFRDVADHLHSVWRLAGLGTPALLLEDLGAGNGLEVMTLVGLIRGLGQAELEDVL